MNYNANFNNRSPKDFIIGLLVAIAIAVIFGLCLNYFPDNFTYGWIAPVLLGIVLVVGNFAINGWEAGFFGVGVLIIMLALLL